MKRFLCLFLSLCLMPGLAACGGAASAGGDLPESVPAGAAVSSAPGCEHEWLPATFAAPETCQKCGETQGEPRPDFFAEHGLSVAGQLPDGEVPVTFSLWLTNDPSTFWVYEDGAARLSQTVTAAEEPGYQTITISVEVLLPIVDRDGALDQPFRYGWVNGLYDLYTGLELPSRNTEGDDSFAYETDIAIDGVDYRIRNSKTTQWTDDGWYLQEDGFDALDKYYHATIQCVVPEDYDGLVFAVFPQIGPLAETGEEDKAPKTVVEDVTPDQLAGGVFFRVGQESAG